MSITAFAYARRKPPSCEHAAVEEFVKLASFAFAGPAEAEIDRDGWMRALLGGSRG